MKRGKRVAVKPAQEERYYFEIFPGVVTRSGAQRTKGNTETIFILLPALRLIMK